MIPVGQTYRAAGPINFRSVVSTLILGTFTAVLAAFVVWLWESSPIPTLLILTPIIQGVFIGLVLAFAIGRLRMRNPKLLLLIGFACGLASQAMVHLGHHIRFVHDVTAQARIDIPNDDTLTPETKKELLELIDKEPEAFVDQILVANIGHGGPIGSLMFRNKQGIEIKNAQVTGTALWLLWGAEALAVACCAAAMAKTRAAQPFCEDCGDWCPKQTAPLVLPGEAGPALANAIRADDLAAVAHLRDQPPETAGRSFTGAILYSCDGCDQTFADVWLRTDKAAKGKTESTTKTLVDHIALSPEMLALLRNEPEPAEEPEGPAIEGDEIPVEEG